MKFIPTDPPRRFPVGRGEPIEMADCGRLALAPNEQVTFVTESGAEYDVARKSWGFYATPSLNGRLASFNLRALLAKSPGGKYYVFLVERGREPDCKRYLDVEGHIAVCWLDSDEALRALEASVPRPAL